MLPALVPVRKAAQLAELRFQAQLSSSKQRPPQKDFPKKRKRRHLAQAIREPPKQSQQANATSGAWPCNKCKRVTGTLLICEECEDDVCKSCVGPGFEEAVGKSEGWYCSSCSQARRQSKYGRSQEKDQVPPTEAHEIPQGGQEICWEIQQQLDRKQAGPNVGPERPEHEPGFGHEEEEVLELSEAEEAAEEATPDHSGDTALGAHTVNPRVQMSRFLCEGPEELDGFTLVTSEVPVPSEDTAVRAQCSQAVGAPTDRSQTVQSSTFMTDKLSSELGEANGGAEEAVSLADSGVQPAERKTTVLPADPEEAAPAREPHLGQARRVTRGRGNAAKAKPQVQLQPVPAAPPPRQAEPQEHKVSTEEAVELVWDGEEPVELLVSNKSQTGYLGVYLRPDGRKAECHLPRWAAMGGKRCFTLNTAKEAATFRARKILAAHAAIAAADDGGPKANEREGQGGEPGGAKQAARSRAQKSLPAHAASSAVAPKVSGEQWEGHDESVVFEQLERQGCSKMPVVWGYTKLQSLVHLSRASAQKHLPEADPRGLLPIQRDGGMVGWAFQRTNSLMMNDYQGQHMVFSPEGYVAVSSDVCDWDTMCEICRQLGAGVRIPKKTYDWISGMTGCAHFPQALKGTISEVLCTIALAQQDGSATVELEARQLSQLRDCITQLLPAQHVEHEAGWHASGASQDLVRGRGGPSQLPDTSPAKLQLVQTLCSELQKALAIVQALLPSPQRRHRAEQQAPRERQSKRACTSRERKISGVDDYWWPKSVEDLESFLSDNKDVVDLTEQCPTLDASKAGRALGSALSQALLESRGGMVCVNNLQCEGLWAKLCTWIRDPVTLDMLGGGQRDVSAGTAQFQLLRMDNGVPKPYRSAATTLDTFLRREWGYPIAAVGLPAWARPGEKQGPSLGGLFEEIMTLMKTLGFKTELQDDVLGLAGIELCGVGVRRPEVYVKRGRGLDEPFITLRHAEWGHSRAFNMVLHSWPEGQKLLREQ